MLIRAYTLNICKRLYHRSLEPRDTPRIKIAGKRVGDAIRRRQEHESISRVELRKPTTKYEPFPFKVTEENRLEVLSKLVTPMADMPYEEQLSHKESSCRNAFRAIARELYSMGTPVRVDASKLPCRINSIVRAPVLQKYRNSEEYSVWRGLDGETPTIGYMAFPISKHGDTVALEPTGLVITREVSDKATDILQKFIRHQANVPVCYELAEQGGWRRFRVRTNDKGHVMIIGIMSPRLLKVKTIVDERENFREFMVSEFRSTGLELKSLYFQPCPHSACSHADVPYELLHGDSSIIETVGDYSIRLTADSNICPNSTGAVNLYKAIQRTIVEDFEQKSSALIIDLNCGVGDNTLHLSHLAEKVIGIDESGLCVDDAKANAQLNGIKNCDFITVNLEVAIERILERHARRSDRVIVVYRSYRGPLRYNVVQALRQCSSIDKMICVTNKLQNKEFSKSIVNLCSKDRGENDGTPFTLLSATPVDTNPHVHSYETVIALERFMDE